MLSVNQETVFKCPKPKCGGTLILRENKNTGSKFLGCTNFPSCHYTEPYKDELEDSTPDAASVWE